MKNAASIFAKTCLKTVLLAAIFSNPAAAESASDIDELIRTRQFDVALAQVNNLLQEHPGDASARLFKGYLLIECGRNDEAISIYSELIEEFPGLAESYNNLGVLLVESGQYDKARNALETAIRINPAYTVAQQNLGDLYARLAVRTYAKALQAEPGNVAAKSKVARIQTLLADGVGGITEPAQQPDLLRAIATAPGESERVLQAVQEWANAWSRRDVKRYLSYYDHQFLTPTGLSRQAWEAQRRARILGKRHIEVSVAEPEVNIAATGATITFRQIYSADQLRRENRKVLELTKHGDQWQIVREHAID